MATSRLRDHRLPVFSVNYPTCRRQPYANKRIRKADHPRLGTGDTTIFRKTTYQPSQPQTKSQAPTIVLD